MKVHDKWEKGWLRKKPMIYNPRHYLYNPVLDRIIRHLNKGQNIIIIIVGVPRSGKSWFSIWLMCYLNYNYYGKEPDFNDIYWKVPKFLDATKNPANQQKFLVMEEQGVEQYKMNFASKELQGFDMLTQIFGVDETNIIVNLPYIFDLFKGTRLKAHLLLRTLKRSSNKVDVVSCGKAMYITTEKAWYEPKEMWNDVPSVHDIANKEMKAKCVEILQKYEEKKLNYNLEKKKELTDKIFGKKEGKKEEKNLNPIITIR